MKIIVIPIIKPDLQYNTETFKISFKGEPNMELADNNFTEDEETIRFHYVWNDYQIIPSNGVAVAPIYKSIKFGKISDGDEIIIVCKTSDRSETIVKYCKLHYETDEKDVRFFLFNENGLKVIQ